MFAIFVIACERPEPELPDIKPDAATPAPDAFAMTIAVDPERPVVGTRSNIRVQVGHGSDPPRLEPIAGHPVHLVAVSSDLRWYQHLHPQRKGNIWTSGITFSVAGRYILYAIIRPPNGPQRVEKQIVIAGGETQSPSAESLSASPREKASGRYTVRLRTKPEPPEATIWSSLIFEISRDGAPVTNLTPTGRPGHMVIIREGGEDFVSYPHSTDGEALSGMRGRAHLPALPNELDKDHRRHIGDTGPEVIFHAQFPHTGKYKLWVEFLAGGDPIRADFVLDVGPPKPLPHRD
ncbi:MAG TPA: hypothetical protein VJZ00_11095 [Thermoanaerobaculia bacterium]|nr:hypothetical protein [Thermoanaerobaculia bacterium]